MKDLFVLNDEGENGSTETSNIFSQLSEDVNIVVMQKDKRHKQEHLRAAGSHSDHGAGRNGNSSNGSHSKRKGKEKDDHSDGEVDEEKNILRSLFDAQGIHVRYVSLSNINIFMEVCTRI